ncbi:MAG: hypothetical protein ACLPTM_16165 [Steroidobacteraceae bacterium]
MRAALAALATLLLTFTLAARAAPAVFVVRADLGSLIRAAADSPVQFAVPVPHAASTATSGSWSVAGGEATWRYAVQVPTAVSLSFHATASSLPDSATLLVSGGQATTSYRAGDVHRGELWSRIHAGDTLELTLTVAAADRDRVALQIVSLQAGFRAIGPGVEDHPVYRHMVEPPGGSPWPDSTSCITNYECKVTPGNVPTSAGTAALIVENLYQCTGTLINDVPGDNTPYLLTARHCETGQLGGGNPQAAAGVTVYWNATSPCGTPLGSIYDGNLPSQSGARTVVEQQDAWLIELDTAAVVSNAQLVGFDASGSAVQGGYTIHNAAGRYQQIVGWFATAFAWEESDDLGTGYVSNFLQTVNQSGNIGPGSSGGGFFDGHDHLVGSLTLGRKSRDPSGYGACPVTPLTAPNGSNGVADFTSLAAVWSSTADPTSSTGGATLRSVLDPAGTGVLVVPSMPVSMVGSGAAPAPAPRISFNPSSVSAGESFTAAWSATNAANCTLTGGIPGGTWGGSTQSVPASGSVTESGPAGSYTFGLICQSLEPNGAAVATQSTLTIAAAASASAPSSAPAAQQSSASSSGGGGVFGVLEGAVLAALLVLRLLRSARSPLRLRSAARLVGLRQRLGQQKRPPRGL